MSYTYEVKGVMSIQQCNVLIFLNAYNGGAFKRRQHNRDKRGKANSTPNPKRPPCGFALWPRKVSRLDARIALIEEMHREFQALH